MSFDKHIITTFVSQTYQWDFDILKPQWIALKIFLGVAVVDDNFAVAFLEDDASDGTFPAASADDRLGCKATGKP